MHARSAEPGHGPMVTLQLFGVRRRYLPRVLWRMAADRSTLRRTPGVTFAKLLGTAGRTFGARNGDLGTWGLLTVWSDEVSRQRWLADSPTLRAWRRISHEEWMVDLVPLHSRGRWSGANPFPVPAEHPRRAHRFGGNQDRAPTRTPVAAITRARLRPQRALRFWRAVPPVVSALHRAEGRLMSIGIGEAPLGLQGTFSVWRDEAALVDFSYRTAAHREVIAATARLDWYAEDLFARFAVADTKGSVHGCDPLAGRRHELP